MLEKHGLNTRSQFIRTKVPRGTVRGWIEEGIPARRSNALAFIHGLGEDLDEGLREAGFGDEPERTGSDILLAGIAALQEEMGRPLRISFHGQIRAGLSVSEAEELLATIRQQAQEGLFD